MEIRDQTALSGHLIISRSIIVDSERLLKTCQLVRALCNEVLNFGWEVEIQLHQDFSSIIVKPRHLFFIIFNDNDFLQVTCRVKFRSKWVTSMTSLATLHSSCSWDPSRWVMTLHTCLCRTADRCPPNKSYHFMTGDASCSQLIALSNSISSSHPLDGIIVNASILVGTCAVRSGWKVCSRIGPRSINNFIQLELVPSLTWMICKFPLTTISTNGNLGTL